MTNFWRMCVTLMQGRSIRCLAATHIDNGLFKNKLTKYKIFVALILQSTIFSRALVLCTAESLQ